MTLISLSLFFLRNEIPKYEEEDHARVKWFKCGKCTLIVLRATTQSPKKKIEKKHLFICLFDVFCYCFWFIQAHMTFNSLLVGFKRLNFSDTFGCRFQYTFDTQIAMPNAIQCHTMRHCFVFFSPSNTLTHRQSIA